MDPLESMAREMLRFLPAMAAADGVRSTATYTDVPEFGFRCARLTVHSIANGDRFVGRFWVSRAGFIFPPESRAMAARLSYLLRRRSHGLILTPGGLRAEGNPSRLRVPSRPRFEIVCDTRLRVWSSCWRPVMCSAWSNVPNLDVPAHWRDRCGRRVELPSAGNLESGVESRDLRYSGADRPREPCGTDQPQPEHGESAPRRDVPDPEGVPRATKPVNGTETHPPGAHMASTRPASIRTTRAGWRRSRGGLQPGCLSYISVTTTVTSAECVMEPIVAVTVTV